MEFPTILHGKKGEEVRCENEDAFNQAIEDGYRDSPACFTPEYEKAEKERKAAEAKAAKEKAEKEARIEKALKLLDEKEGKNIKKDK